jgi:hypothetical protein
MLFGIGFVLADDAVALFAFDAVHGHAGTERHAILRLR